LSVRGEGAVAVTSRAVMIGPEVILLPNFLSSFVVGAGFTGPEICRFAVWTGACDVK
jgi:hypothetical protein